MCVGEGARKQISMARTEAEAQGHRPQAMATHLYVVSALNPTTVMVLSPSSPAGAEEMCVCARSVTVSRQGGWRDEVGAALQ